jgi:hypothetical protein
VLLLVLVLLLLVLALVLFASFEKASLNIFVTASCSSEGRTFFCPSSYRQNIKRLLTLSKANRRDDNKVCRFPIAGTITRFYLLPATFLIINNIYLLKS